MSEEPMMNATLIQDLVERILLWFKRNARDLPWRSTDDPYRIWISELMLQQTQVARVIPFYENFLQRFPSLESVCAASVEEVLVYWSGLGYYKRCVYMKQTAEILVREFAGRFPKVAEEYDRLPGVGAYTRGAILSLAYNLAYPAVDVNVARLLARVFCLQSPLNSASSQHYVQARVREMLPYAQPRHLTQALMEFGACVCVSKVSVCGDCVVNDLCVAYRKGLVESIPKKPPKRPREQYYYYAFVFEYRGRFFIVRRKDSEQYLPSLWEFPLFLKPGGDAEGVCGEGALFAELGLLSGRSVVLGSIKHSITYRRLYIDVCFVHLTTQDKQALESGVVDKNYAWIYARELASLPRSSWMDKLLHLVNNLKL